MVCHAPVDCWRGPPGRGGIVFDRRKTTPGAEKLRVPCGQCSACRVTRSQDWATRLYHEASQHELSSFLTLTYSDENYPEDGSIAVRPLQLFMKRLRKRTGVTIRFFGCGEYGDKLLRPHYHLLIFGYDFPDKRPWRKTNSGFVTYRSEFLEQLWTQGHSEIGSVTLQSSGYVARYIMKKVHGRNAEEYYTRIHPFTGEIVQLKPEFIVMSKGIGREWYDKFSGDAFPSDFVVVDGQKRPVPRYYTKKLEASDEAAHAEIKLKRKERGEANAANNTPERLATREESLSLKLKRLKREME